MNWYLTKIVYQIVCGNGNHTPQFDEQLRLILASNENEAFNKAQRIGKMEEESFMNDKNNLVKWIFIDVCEIYKLSECIDGAEVYSHVQETYDAKLYIEMLRNKADHLQNNSTFLQSLQII